MAEQVESICIPFTYTYDQFITFFYDGRVYLSDTCYPIGQCCVDVANMDEEVLDEIDRMPAQRREVFRLSRIEGLTNDEIARRLRISKRTVEGHLNAALRTLRVKVGKFVCWLTFFILLQ